MLYSRFQVLIDFQKVQNSFLHRIKNHFFFENVKPKLGVDTNFIKDSVFLQYNTNLHLAKHLLPDPYQYPDPETGSSNGGATGLVCPPAFKSGCRQLLLPFTFFAF